VLEDFPEFALAMRKEGVKRIVEKLSLFKDFSKEFRDHLIELLKPQSFVGGEYIIRKGDVGNEMYFLCKGNVEVCSGDGKTVYKVLHDGEFFGELALLTSQR
jgi:voltage-gated potassium channel